MSAAYFKALSFLGSPISRCVSSFFFLPLSAHWSTGWRCILWFTHPSSCFLLSKFCKVSFLYPAAQRCTTVAAEWLSSVCSMLDAQPNFPRRSWRSSRNLHGETMDTAPLLASIRINQHQSASNQHQTASNRNNQYQPASISINPASIQRQSSINQHQLASININQHQTLTISINQHQSSMNPA